MLRISLLIFLLFVNLLQAYPQNKKTKKQKKSSQIVEVEPILKSTPILQHQEEINIEALEIVNSEADESNPFITFNGKTLLFLTNRGGNAWNQPYGIGKDFKKIFDGDIYISSKNEKNEWTSPNPISADLNTSDSEDEPFVNPSMSRVYFQSWKKGWQVTGGPYYSVDIDNGSMKKLKGLGGGINTFFVDKLQQNNGMIGTDGSTFSNDESKFIVAEGDYYGNMDLQMSVKDTNGRWGEVITLTHINTAYNERTPFLAADGKTLYFSSNGYQGFGGLDIYKTTLNDDGTFGEIINLGAPFNTAIDDYGFIISQDGTQAFLVRNGDIYFIDLTEKASSIKPMNEP